MPAHHVTTLAALLAAALLMPACHSPFGPPPDPFTPAQTSTDKPLQGRPKLGMPITIPGRALCIVPLTVEDTKVLLQDRDPYTRGGVRGGMASASFGSRWEPSGPGGAVRWHNALFRDLRGADQWPLLTRRGVISAWHPLGPRDERGALTDTRALIFIVTQRDTNGDQLLDDRDERIAMLTDADGRNAREITPVGGQVWSMHFEDALDTLYLLIVTDSNGDGRIDHADEPAPYALRLDVRDPAAPVITRELIDHAMALLR